MGLNWHRQAETGFLANFVFFLYNKKKALRNGIVESLLKECKLCPRNCKVNRLIGEKGVCGADGTLKVARAALHFWEEPCISGEKGSGTVFFSHCNLKCIYCQNCEISRGEAGKEITVQRLSDIFLELQQKGANNINLVTPTHYIPQIIKAVKTAREKGLNLPIVYNTSGYETPENIRLLAGTVDIYLTDFKYMDKTLAKLFSKAEDYPDYAKKALDEMFLQVGTPVFNDDDILQKGIIVRHLLLPAHLKDSKQILNYLYERYQNKIYYSLMNQYTPMKKLDYPELNKKVSNKEYQDLIDHAIDLGIENGFVQEGETNKKSYIPPFDNEGV